MPDDKYQDAAGSEPGHEPLAKGVPGPSYTPTSGVAINASSHGGGPPRVVVSFGPKAGPFTPDEDLWKEIRRRTASISFNEYSRFIDSLLTDPIPPATGFNTFDRM